MDNAWTRRCLTFLTEYTTRFPSNQSTPTIERPKYLVIGQNVVVNIREGEKGGRDQQFLNTRMDPGLVG